MAKITKEQLEARVNSLVSLVEEREAIITQQAQTISNQNAALSLMESEISGIRQDIETIADQNLTNLKLAKSVTETVQQAVIGIQEAASREYPIVDGFWN
jgi:predicted metal-dependent hydrolase